LSICFFSWFKLCIILIWEIISDELNFNLVTLEINIIRFLNLTNLEITALILHEFGHILNYFDGKPDNITFLKALETGDMDAVKNRLQRPKELRDPKRISC
jgi:hypothetical protein